MVQGQWGRLRTVELSNERRFLVMIIGSSQASWVVAECPFADVEQGSLRGEGNLNNDRYSAIIKEQIAVRVAFAAQPVSGDQREVSKNSLNLRPRKALIESISKRYHFEITPVGSLLAYRAKK